VVMWLKLRLFGRKVSVFVCLSAMFCVGLPQKVFLNDEHTHREQEAPGPSILVTPMAVTGSASLKVSAGLHSLAVLSDPTHPVVLKKLT